MRRDTYAIDVNHYPVTLDQDAIKALPVYLPWKIWRLGTSGSGCSGDPPGFPTYYAQSVLNARGGRPARAPTAVIRAPDNTLRVLPEVGDKTQRDAWGHLYLPLPFDHVRVQLWVADTMAGHANAYVDEERSKPRSPKTLLIPVPDWRLKTYQDDPSWTKAYRAAARAEVRAFNKMETERATRIATVDNHCGVRRIREVYPDFMPDPTHLSNPPPRPSGSWWTTANAAPTPEECPGGIWDKHGIAPQCGWCGWINPNPLALWHRL